ncbi:MAG: hypothetical protein Q8J74_12985 [Candidatus Didemnitutus sp.]|nr:hypothetical protein [Candidatus Didemnitutus sp.]
MKKRESVPATAPAWHPNFRNPELLPDTKVVRTTFFINAAAVAIAVALLGFVGWREYLVHVLVQQTDAAQAAIDKNRKANLEGLRLTKIFTDEEKKFAEAAAFVSTRLDPMEFVAVLGQNLPAEIQLEYLDIRPNDLTNPHCTLRGLAAGSKDQASGIASAYVAALHKYPRFAEVFESVTLTALNTDSRSGMLIFEIVLKFKTDTKGGKKP